MDTLPLSAEGVKYLLTNWFPFVTNHALVFASLVALVFVFYVAYITQKLTFDPSLSDTFQLLVQFNDITYSNRSRHDTHYEIKVIKKRKGFKKITFITIETALSRPLRFRGIVTNNKTNTAFVPKRPMILFIDQEGAGHVRQLRDSGDVIFEPADRLTGSSYVTYFSVVNADDTKEEVKVLIKRPQQRRIQNGR